MGNRNAEIPGFVPAEFRDVDYAVLSEQIWEQVRSGQINPQELAAGQVAGITFNDSGDLASKSKSAVFIGEISGVTEHELPWSRGKRWDLQIADNPFWVTFGDTPVNEGAVAVNAYRSPNRDYPIIASIYEKPEEIFFAPWQNPRDGLGISGGLAFSVTPELMAELDRVAGFIPEMDKLIASLRTNQAA